METSGTIARKKTEPRWASTAQIGIKVLYLPKPHSRVWIVPVSGLLGRLPLVVIPALFCTAFTKAGQGRVDAACNLGHMGAVWTGRALYYIDSVAIPFPADDPVINLLHQWSKECVVLNVFFNMVWSSVWHCHTMPYNAILCHTENIWIHTVVPTIQYIPNTYHNTFHNMGKWVHINILHFTCQLVPNTYQYHCQYMPICILRAKTSAWSTYNTNQIHAKYIPIDINTYQNTYQYKFDSAHWFLAWGYILACIVVCFCIYRKSIEYVLTIILVNTSNHINIHILNLTFACIEISQNCCPLGVSTISAGLLK